MFADLLVLIFAITTIVVYIKTLMFLALTAKVYAILIDVCVLILAVPVWLVLRIIIRAASAPSDYVSNEAFKLVSGVFLFGIVGLTVAYWLIDRITAALVYAFLR